MKIYISNRNISVNTIANVKQLEFQFKCLAYANKKKAKTPVAKVPRTQTIKNIIYILINYHSVSAIFSLTKSLNILGTPKYIPYLVSKVIILLTTDARMN